MATLSFNAANVAPSQVYAPLPAGDYNAIITESETKATKDGQGQYLQLKLQIQGGEFSGRTLFDRLNLWNNNQQAQEIAQRALSAICHAVGILQVGDSQELHNRPLIATVKVKPASGNYEANNEIKGYKAAQLSAAPAFVPPQAQPAAPAFAQPPAAKAPAAFGAAGMPWMKAA